MIDDGNYNCVHCGLMVIYRKVDNKVFLAHQAPECKSFVEFLERVRKELGIENITEEMSAEEIDKHINNYRN